MKKPLRLSLLFCGLVLLLSVAGLLIRSNAPVPEASQTARPLSSDDTSSPAEILGQPALVEESTPKVSTLDEPSDVIPEDLSEFARFNEWAARYVAANEADRRGMLEEGIVIAQARRIALLELIETDPRGAIENAVPPVIRQLLPFEVVEKLEERVNEKAFFGVLGIMPSAENPPTPAYRREVKTDDGGRYRAFVYGERLGQPTTENASIVGIAVDDMMAIDERPLRTVASGEIMNHLNNLTRRRTVTLLDEQGFSAGRDVLTSAAPPHDVVETCPISGEVTAVENDNDEVAATDVVVEANGQFHFLCRGGHIEVYEEQLLLREGGNGGPSLPTNPPTATQGTGYKSHLLMRVAFPEALKGLVTEKEGHDLGKNVQDWFLNSSYGAMSFMTTVTPLIVLPRSEAWYKDQDTDGGADEVLIDARVAAKLAGYDPANFNFDTVIYTGTPGSFGGQAYVGGKGCWLRSASTGIACHEYGHNFGLWHANFWSTTNGSVIGGGTHVEYGDSFDTMGSASAGDYHFNTYEKNLLNWLPTPLVSDVTTSGTYRIYQMDQPVQNPELRYAIKTRKDTDRDYWVDFRQLFTSNAWLQGGVFIHWDRWALSERGSHLLDTTPGSIDGKNDAPLVIGRTFSDPETGIHITPISKNSTTPPSADVVVNLGMFPGNQAPVVLVDASATSVGTNVAVNFTATASDPNGDVLSYAWDYGDKSFSITNSPNVSKSWASAGEYRVRCTVSDMKGKTVSASVIVTVGSPTTFRIAGTITAGGQPLADVRVDNAKTGTAYREAITDADGTYTIVGLAAGTYTLATELYGYTLTPTGSASVTVGSSKTGINFTASNQSSVSIAVTDADCSEGSNTGSFRISRTGSTTAALTVRLYTPSGSATKTTDYTLAPDVVAVSPYQTFTIPAGQAFLDVVLTAKVDASVESFESIILELVPSTSYLLGDPSATLWIADGNTSNSLVRLSVTDRDADESGDPGQFVIERIGSTTASLNVSVSLNSATGNATNGTDYATIPTTITIPAGASSVAVNVTPIQDTVVENVETVILTINTNAAYTRASSSASNSGTVYLHDDDQPTLTVVATDNTASEAGSDSGVFTITRTGSTAASLTVNYGISGSGLHGTDYVALPGVLTIPAGSSVGTVVITPIDDTIGEPSQTVLFQLRGGISYTVGSPSNATVTITDDDLPYVTAAVTTGPAIEGSTAGVFKVTTTGTGTGNITVRYTVSGTATDGVDYTSLSGTLSIGKNATGNISISTIQDALVEGYETVTITLDPDPAYSLAVDSSATMNILDDDAPQVNVSSTDDAFTEANGSLAKFFVSRTGSTTGALTVNYTLGGTATSGADYTTPSGSVTIASGAAGAYVNISMLADSLAEGTETIVLNVTPGASAYSVGNGSATRYIVDSQLSSLARQVRFSTSSSSVAENAGMVNIPVTLDAAAANNITVEYYINGGMALAGGIDYQLAEGALTFLPGETSKNISVAILDDTLPESSETIIIALRYSYNAKLGTSSHTLTITDNDSLPTATVGFAGTTGSGLESLSPAPLTVALSRALGTSATVNYAVTGGTASSGSDYTISAGTLTFAAGETVKVIPNTIINNTSVESDETIILTLSNPSGASLSANSVFTYTIIDDDATTVSIEATDADAAEPIADTGLFTVTRTGSTASALTVYFGITGSATSGADYLNLPTSLVIPAGASSATLLLTPVDDNVVEPIETVILTLTPGVYTIAAANTATISIGDDDADLFVTITASDANASEQPIDSGEFTVSRTGVTTANLTVNLGITGTTTNGSDYTTLPSSVVIPAGSSNVGITVTPLSDALIEGDETVILTALTGSGYSVGAPSSATVTIVDALSSTPPTLASSDIVDDKGGTPVFVQTPVTYTVTFSRDMDASTVAADDFGNAGSASASIGTVTETTPTSGVFLVSVTPTSAGTLQLKVNADAVLNDITGNNLITTPVIADDTTITVTGTELALVDALDTNGLTWTSGGDMDWFYQTAISNDGIDAAQSGAITDGQSSAMETTVTGPGNLTFWWKVSSEANYDFLSLYLDGALQTGSLAKISGTVDWVQRTVPIPAGSHTLKWEYAKDVDTSSGSDTAWVDQVVYSPNFAPEIAVEQPVDTNLVDGIASVDCGSINLGSSSSPITFTVKNLGNDNLTGLALSKDGSHSADFTLGSLGATTLAPGGSTTFTVSFTPGAAGSRSAAIHIASNDADENPFDIALTGTGVPLGTLAVTPAGDLTSSGNFGGPFSPTSQQYMLSNTGSTAINWTAAKTAAWVDLSATSGTLAAGANTTVTVSFSDNANTLNIGDYSDTVSFNNATNNNGNTTRGVSLSVDAIPATIEFGDLTQTYNGSPKSAAVTTDPSGLLHSITYDGSATPPTDAGTYAVVATITEPNYSGSDSTSLVIVKASQTIDFTAPEPVPDDQLTFELTATVASELPISYTSSNTAVATVLGSTVTIVGIGSTDITASQEGDSNYNAAAPVVQTLDVVRANPLAATGGPYALVFGQSLSLNGNTSEPSYGETVTTYEWDLNNDNTFGDATGATPAAISYASLTTTWGRIPGDNTIQLKVTDSAGKTSITATTLTLITTLTWDSNNTGAGQTNGAGAWLGANQWWDGSANLNWVPGSDAAFGGPSTAGGAVTLASPTTVNSIILNSFTSTYTLGTAANSITLNGGITKNTGVGAATIISPVVLGGSQSWTNNSAGILTLSGALDTGTATSPDNYTLTGDGSGTTTISGVISGTGGIVKNGSGRVSFGTGNVANTYTGPTTINGGILSIANNSASLGSGNLKLNGGVLGFYWGSGLTRTLGTGDGQVQILGGESGFGGDGTTGPTINLGATVVWGASGEGTATGFFNPSKFVLGSFDTSNAGITIFSSAINMNGATRTFVVPKGLSAGGNVATISGAISSTGTAGLIKEGAGTLILSTANSYTGPTTISGGSLRIGNNTAGTLNSGNYSGNISIASGATLQIWSNTAQVLSGTISGGGGVNKAYSGALTLSGPNTYTGRTSFLPQNNNGYTVNITSFNSVNGGTPLMTSSSLGAPTTPTNGTIDIGDSGKQAGVNLTYTGPGETTDRVINFGFNGSATQTLTASGSGLLKFTSAMTASSISNQTGKLTLAGNGLGEISEAIPALPSGGLTKTGSGTWTLGGSSSYTGPTTISDGKLFFNGSLSNTAGTMSVGTGATLGGTGTIGRNVTVAAGGKLEFNISSIAASHSHLNISSGRDFAFAGASVLTITSSSGAAPGTYTLITGGNNITGVAPATVNLPANWTASVSISGNSLLLNIVSTGGPGPVDHFVISSIGSTRTVGTPITGITITAQDSSNATATSFTGTVTFGGTGGFSGTSASFSAGVLSGVNVTPTVAGSNLTLTVNDGAGHTGSTVIATIQSVYNGWSGNLEFNVDSNGDGIANGMAWVLGATDPSTKAIALLPTFDKTSDANYFIFSYRRSDAANAAAIITCQYGNDLSSNWTPAIHDGTNVIITVSDDFYGASPGIDKVEVKIKRSMAVGGKLFSRLNVKPTP